MLVDKPIYETWSKKYGSVNPIKRFGIEDESGEKVVEIYLKQVNLLCIPNAKLLKLYKGNNIETSPIYVSKGLTVDDLMKKICRLLSAYLYF